MTNSILSNHIKVQNYNKTKVTKQTKWMEIKVIYKTIANK